MYLAQLKGLSHASAMAGIKEGAVEEVRKVVPERHEHVGEARHDGERLVPVHGRHEVQTGVAETRFVACETML